MDDVSAPNARTLSAPPSTTVKDIISIVARGYQLPEIIGGRATWVLASEVPLAVFAQEWSEPRPDWRIPSRLEDLDYDGKVLRLHFSYLAQYPPEDVENIVRRLRFRAL
jgi:hypothetical protein